MTARGKLLYDVKHKDGYKVRLRVDPKIDKNLKDRDYVTRNIARDAICLQFRKACQKKYPGWNYGRHVQWHEILVTPVANKPKPEYRDDDPRECDECPSCEQGFHERCRSDEGCPQAF